MVAMTMLGIILRSATLAIIFFCSNVIAFADELDLGAEAFDRGDLMSAIGHFRTAAEDGDAEAQVRLAWILDQAEENDEAAYWYRQAADQDYPAGIGGLAELYAKGEGVPRDLDRAYSHFVSAANRGHLASVRVLTAAFENGELDRKPDAEKAAYWRGREAELVVARNTQEEQGNEQD